MPSKLEHTIAFFVHIFKGIKHGFALAFCAAHWICAHAAPIFDAIYRFLDRHGEPPMSVTDNTGRAITTNNTTDVEAQRPNTGHAFDADIEPLLLHRRDIATQRTQLDLLSARTMPGSPVASTLLLKRFDLVHEDQLNNIAIEAELRAKYPSRAEYVAMCDRYGVAPFST